MRTSQRTSHRTPFMGGIDIQNCKIKRQIEIITIRKNKRTETLMKKRGMMSSEEDVISDDIPTDDSLMVEKLYSDDMDIVHEALVFFRKKISVDTDSFSVNYIIRSGILPKIISCLYLYARHDIQLQCAWIITNITASDEDYFDSIKSAINPLIQLFIISPCEDIREQSIWALSNIMSEHNILEYTKSSNILKYLSKYLMNTKNISFVKTGLWALCNIIRMEKLSDVNIVETFEIIKKYISIRNDDILSMIFWILGNISRDGVYNQMLYDYKIIHILMKYIDGSVEKSTDFCIYSVKILGNIFALENKNHIQTIIDYGFLSKLKELILDNRYEKYLKEFCWILSNITAGEEKHIELVLHHNFLHTIKELSSKFNTDTKIEVLWIISNIIAKKNSFYINYVLNCGYLSFILDNIKNLAMEYLCLEIIHTLSTTTILNEDTIDILEEILLETKNDKIFSLTEKIIENILL